MSAQFQIGSKPVGRGAPCFLIAEVALAHEGSLGMAHAYIDAAAEAGADAVKFQTHIAAEESTPDEQFRVKVFPQDATRYAYWQRTSFTEEQWQALKQHAETRGLEFLSTPFSVAAVRLLRRLGVKAWKIGSGETNNFLLLEEVAIGKEPVLMSTGMSFLQEVDASLRLLQSRGAPVLVMQCTNRYPCPPEHLGLNVIPEYQKRYDLPIGFSDHSGEIAPGLAAVTLGAKALEVHVTWHSKCFGPDVKASLTFERFAELVKGVRILERALDSTVSKDAEAEELAEMRKLFTKGLVAKDDIQAGTPIERRHFEAKKPCLGIPAAEYGKVLGKIAARDIKRDQHITWSDLR
jgi:N,N'-diacetyllegionaminate synthase